MGSRPPVSHFPGFREIFSGDYLMTEGFRSFLEPGFFVVHPHHPEWGRGQVQSAAGHRVTVNFEHAGKVLIDARVVTLDVIG